ncbi:hypothetical protein SDC9_193594 [bioreactor metagenome]|uniref:Uncharacterized protein n=1 Tax=bioreactor metagenome TaxID=1076179 RepID=A0A645I3Z0_9ZZZZ
MLFKVIDHCLFLLIKVNYPDAQIGASGIHYDDLFIDRNFSFRRDVGWDHQERLRKLIQSPHHFLDEGLSGFFQVEVFCVHTIFLHKSIYVGDHHQ